MTNTDTPAQIRVWLDDRRTPPDGAWIWVTTPAEAIDLLRAGGVDVISLDHDLGLFGDDDTEETGHDVLLWIEEQVVTAGFEPPTLRVHSANPPAHERMQRAIASIERLSADSAAG